jgi:hypothetical protein
MPAQQMMISDVTDERSAQLYLQQAMMVTFCRVLDSSRLPPAMVMRLLATALGTTYREVALAHQDGSCPCGWCPVAAIDIDMLRSSLADAASPTPIDDLQAMEVAGRA